MLHVTTEFKDGIDLKSISVVNQTPKEHLYCKENMHTLKTDTPKKQSQTWKLVTKSEDSFKMTEIVNVDHAGKVPEKSPFDILTLSQDELHTLQQ